MKRFEITLPRVQNTAERASNDNSIAAIARTIASISGGVTIHDVSGIWLDDNGHAVYDDNTLLFTYCDENALARVIALVPSFRDLLAQDALVYAVVDTEVTFVS